MREFDRVSWRLFSYIDESVASRTCDLALLQFCPRYTTVLQRTEDEGIGEDELDTMQLELENLLSNVSKRMRLLESALLCNFAMY